ncbi:MAG TPA: YbaK/EbsC family protein [Candidatus Limnocylindrales bacterium]|nr:YbaK/EbsC family protein [Candidatus Limnocylindrales bacterium]
MNATSTLDRPHGGLLAWLADRGIEHEVHTHPESFTARATADAEGVDPRTFAKVVAVATADGRHVLLVLDASDRVDLRKARRALETDDVRLLTEAELAAVVPDCEAGALPAVGPLFGLPMVADFAVRDDPEISFNAGTHRASVRVDRAAWEAAAGVVYADLAADDEVPAWARS